jgi:hypothetical protein
LDATKPSAFNPEVRIDELYLQAVSDPALQADPTPQGFTAAFTWSGSTEHESGDPLECYSFGWDHVVIERGSVPQFEAVERFLKLSSLDRFVDLTDDLNAKERAELWRLGHGNRVSLSDDRMTVHLSYPGALPRLVRYMPGPTVPWQGPWQPAAGRAGLPFDFPWNPRFCTSDSACFQIPADRKARTTMRYVLDRQTGDIHRLHLAREAFWFNSFGTSVRRTACLFG